MGLVGGSGSGSTIGIGMVDRSWFMFMVHVHGSWFKVHVLHL